MDTQTIESRIYILTNSFKFTWFYSTKNMDKTLVRCIITVFFYGFCVHSSYNETYAIGPSNQKCEYDNLMTIKNHINCEIACRSLHEFKQFGTGKWTHSPGCFFVQTGNKIPNLNCLDL